MSRYTEQQLREMALSYEQFFNARDPRCTELCILLAMHFGIEPSAAHAQILSIAHGGPIP